jgi:hypothetical protein
MTSRIITLLCRLYAWSHGVSIRAERHRRERRVECERRCGGER